jgi:hypothetical protein
LKFFIISYVNSLERRKYVAVWFSSIQSRLQCLPVQYSYIHTTYTVNSFCKAFAHVRNCLLKKKHMAQTKTLTDSTRKRQFTKLCVKIKKRCYTDLLHFSTHKHNLVFFFRPNRILTVELHRSFLYILFFRRKR